MEKLISNKSIVFREEFDDWALLYDPDTGDAYGLNPVSALIWKHLDGDHSTGDISRELHKDFDDVPESVDEDLREFLDTLKEKGFAGTELHRDREEP
jgi:SynChlorMet cassette protein ScmD